MILKANFPFTNSSYLAEEDSKYKYKLFEDEEWQNSLVGEKLDYNVEAVLRVGNLPDLRLARLETKHCWCNLKRGVGPILYDP